MKQLTLRGFDKDLGRRIRELARRQGISLNRAAIRLLRKGAGLTSSHGRANVVGDSLDHLIGSWSEDEEQAILEALAVFEQVEEQFWDEGSSR